MGDQLNVLLAENKQLKELVLALDNKIDVIQTDVKEMKEFVNQARKDSTSPLNVSKEEKKLDFKHLFARKGKHEGKPDEKKKPEKKSEKEESLKKELAEDSEEMNVLDEDKRDHESDSPGEEKRELSKEPSGDTGDENPQVEHLGDGIIEEHEAASLEDKSPVGEKKLEMSGEKEEKENDKKEDKKELKKGEKSGEKKEDKHEKKEEKKKVVSGRGRARSFSTKPYDESAGPILLEGELIKQGVRGIKIWKKRTF